MPQNARTVDEEEIAKFSSRADAWWDDSGAFAPLHDITPLRIGYIRDRICTSTGRDTSSPLPLNGLSLLDVGCGGGLASEPLARLGAHVEGIDASEENITIARIHAERMGLAIDYHATTAEAWVEKSMCYDAVIALEMIEHVADVQLLLSSLVQLTKPNGLIILSTINRTLSSLLLAKYTAEYILRWVPRGTHDWNRFLRPSELIMPLEELGCSLEHMSGMRYAPLARTWELAPDALSMNYLICMKKIDH
ncbi:MAG: bifunctional 2-polyprenyl-6-hydroxyphenol methylase/3-demethylubiquinol 3-O-methyltransferase UbiG [Alphaproteobacteria bacterium]|nr:MAG: bifunctional 2-polyprenyl-6-hydroxyphenol methylase/3-demethylubiquinol 3-O-methyltransferase UbiG [Alphaproteobacteria bacterium]TAF13705.1 MAG: bifunctional 2-polyprenyl-6-hydroxyphenol methylase/3-demethylubiquinol 3-O-methyltransferase UbiG [Alphaproteobacteria bacterium]TAF38349.1 MAG: bifunctional 2-polyprenyl-6-hydroxyphenol methylase/3-demethylubiquinol 3-O-methyltransferase UbiG [Alphaproteobacteria bacterium]TAF76256.1 MAG: bifunctional 2-polyprenyl-6-hydroxyphenol methylase/3-